MTFYMGLNGFRQLLAIMIEVVPRGHAEAGCFFLMILDARQIQLLEIPDSSQ